MIRTTQETESWDPFADLFFCISHAEMSTKLVLPLDQIHDQYVQAERGVFIPEKLHKPCYIK